ncbi:MAG TPA: hypothetical protein VEJ44_06750, partial [Acidimicrobiales bacterium]|nr:hypothetical protein [Acidimicrobiales bacterium]
MSDTYDQEPDDSSALRSGRVRIFGAEPASQHPDADTVGDPGDDDDDRSSGWPAHAAHASDDSDASDRIDSDGFDTSVPDRSAADDDRYG